MKAYEFVEEFRKIITDYYKFVDDILESGYFFKKHNTKTRLMVDSLLKKFILNNEVLEKRFKKNQKKTFSNIKKQINRFLVEIEFYGNEIELVIDKLKNIEKIEDSYNVFIDNQESTLTALQDLTTNFLEFEEFLKNRLSLNIRKIQSAINVEEYKSLWPKPEQLAQIYISPYKELVTKKKQSLIETFENSVNEIYSKLLSPTINIELEPIDAIIKNCPVADGNDTPYIMSCPSIGLIEQTITLNKRIIVEARIRQKITVDFSNNLNKFPLQAKNHTANNVIGGSRMKNKTISGLIYSVKDNIGRTSDTIVSQLLKENQKFSFPILYYDEDKNFGKNEIEVDHLIEQKEKEVSGLKLSRKFKIIHMYPTINEV